ncbi:MAG: PHP domain-containing protein [Chloroflexi bacterium]|nr:PHP domain-containing protein [Chloroflexota bacterium]
MSVDLHLHTTVSDGRLTPTQLVDAAGKRGLRVIAVTDHDSTQGLEEAFAAGARYPEMTIIPGIELSTDIPRSEVHILGYFLRYQDEAFQATLREFREARYDRGRRMVEKLKELDIHVSWERVRELAQGGAGSVGRPHVAQAMWEGGYVSSVQEAFDRYIGRNGPAYADRPKLTPAEAVGLVRRVGGLAVLAHPKDVLDNLDPILDDLCAAGLAGMEAYYQGYEGQLNHYLLDVCAARNLIPCGGSDYHGIESRPEAGIGNVAVPLETAERLFALAGVPLRQRVS